MTDTSNSQCPFHSGPTNADWWPNQLNLKLLDQNDSGINPLDPDFDYAEAFAGLDYRALKADLAALMTDSQPWWPADYGHYGGLFVRMSWHAAGTYRVEDGRGGGGTGNQRFAPLNSWPDNASLDKARRLLWPIKQKYGNQISWADLMLLAGNVALETMGFKTWGFGAGRTDIWAPEDDINWGTETTWLDDDRYSGERELDKPLGAVQMGLIYVNPEGPNGNPDPLAAAHDIRETFARMAMNDEETVALIAGGHTFGKTHGAVKEENIGREPEGAPVEDMGIGWRNAAGTGVGADSYTSGLEGAWTNDPIQWDNGFFENLFGYEWELFDSPAGAKQWRPADGAGEGTVPEAHGDGATFPVMLTTDLSLRFDPDYGPISRRFLENPDQFAEAFAKAWFKLLHRDMGPVSRYLGPEVPASQEIWQDPISGAPSTIDDNDVAALKSKIADSGLSVSQLVITAWASAATFRRSDMRGGANGARINLAPMNGWDVNIASGTADVIDVLDGIRNEFNGAGGSQVSLADMIVLGGVSGIETAASAAGHDVVVPFTPGRGDATAEETEIDSVDYLEPRFDGFRNYVPAGSKLPQGHLLVERATLLGLTAPEMVVLIGGMRALGANAGGSSHGVLTSTPGTLDNSFFVNLIDMTTEWKPSANDEGVYEGRDRVSDELRWTGTPADLAIGSNSQLRAISEIYAQSDSGEKFVRDFISAWDKVMMADRFDV